MTAPCKPSEGNQPVLSEQVNPKDTKSPIERPTSLLDGQKTDISAGILASKGTALTWPKKEMPPESTPSLPSHQETNPETSSKSAFRPYNMKAKASENTVRSEYTAEEVAQIPGPTAQAITHNKPAHLEDGNQRLLGKHSTSRLGNQKREGTMGRWTAHEKQRFIDGKYII